LSKNTSIIPLVEKWEEYLKVSMNPSIEDFSFWLYAKYGGKSTNSFINFDSYVDVPKFNSNESFITYLIMRLSKHIKHYVKPILNKYGLNSIDDFAILATILWKQRISKKEVCLQNLSEISTGLDIIRRLQNLGLIEEVSSLEDKRVKLLIPTSHGISEMQRIIEGFSILDNKIILDLKDNDIETLKTMLFYLDSLHTKNYLRVSE
jgi:DNA-binding MarR family transcriptional regulator